MACPVGQIFCPMGWYHYLMSHKRLLISSAIIAFVVLISFSLSVPHTRDIAQKPLSAAVTENVPVVTLRDAFKKGLHTISGSLQVPNACTAVSASATLAGNASSTEGMPAQAGILVAISAQPDSGVCLQLSTQANFQTTISAPANLPFTVTVNGSEATVAPS